MTQVFLRSAFNSWRLNGPIRTRRISHASPALDGLWRSKSQVCQRACAPSSRLMVLLVLLLISVIHRFNLLVSDVIFYPYPSPWCDYFFCSDPCSDSSGAILSFRYTSSWQSLVCGFTAVWMWCFFMICCIGSVNLQVYGIAYYVFWFIVGLLCVLCLHLSPERCDRSL